ncbi:MAG: Sir2 family NAD-dependent protein deacetylase [Actinomycetota bacterium]
MTDVRSDAPIPEALASAILTAQVPVMLTGIRLGEQEPMELSRRGEWSQRASLEAFLTDPARFWEYFYPRGLEIAARTPNAGHLAIARLQQAGLLAHLITQSSDRLHQKAGSSDVVEVYGNLTVARCDRCGERYGLPEIGSLIAASPDGVPRCTIAECGYPLRPAGTLWAEPLPPAAVSRAWEIAAQADLFIVLDSPLRTAPISLLPSVPLTRRRPLVMIGSVPTQYDRYAAVVSREPTIEVLTALVDLVCPAPRP